MTTRRSERILQHSRDLSRELSEGVSEATDAGRLARAVRARPLRSVLIAAGAGYLLGHGLWTPLTGRLLRVGARVLIWPLLQHQLIARLQTPSRELH